MCGATATAAQVAWPILAALVAVVGVIGLAYLVDSVVTREPPNYNLARTTACLRAKGFAVSRPFPTNEWRPRYPEVTIRAGRNRFSGPLDAIFTPSSHQAHKMAEALDNSVPLATRRNIVFNYEQGLPLGSEPLEACLQS